MHVSYFIIACVIYRRNRRNKKTRYHKARFENRKSSVKSNRFSPTMASKINSHLKEINFVKKILPIRKPLLTTHGDDIKHKIHNMSKTKDFKKQSMDVERCGSKLLKEFWVEKTFWSDCYFVCTTGEASKKTIEEYIANQG